MGQKKKKIINKKKHRYANGRHGKPMMTMKEKNQEIKIIKIIKSKVKPIS